LKSVEIEYDSHSGKRGKKRSLDEVPEIRNTGIAPHPMIKAETEKYRKFQRDHPEEHREDRLDVCRLKVELKTE
jgi:hypothetical protein